MKHFTKAAVLAVLALFCALAAFGQCTPNQQAFDTAYWAAQAPAVAALRNTAYPADASTATALAAEGFGIDVDIMVYHFDACLVMSRRQEQGLTWVPNSLQPPLVMVPAPSWNGQPYNAASPPAGSLKVSTKASDFPAFTPSATASATPRPANPVGALSYGSIYVAVPGDTLGSGSEFTDSRGTFKKTVVATPSGNVAYWTLIKPAPATSK